jgi:hypothetical protein
VTFAQRACFATLAGGLVVLVAGPAHADPDILGLGLSFDAGPAVVKTARTLPSTGTSLAVSLSVAGSISIGPLVAGISADGTYDVFSDAPQAFGGGFLGGELKLGRLVFQLAAEGGGHLVVNPGADWSHTSTAPNVLLPYLGGRLRIDRLVHTWSRQGSIVVGVSAFVREDVKHELVAGVVSPTCFGIDEGCQPGTTTSQFDVGGTTAGIVLDFSWWMRGWF